MHRSITGGSETIHPIPAPPSNGGGESAAAPERRKRGRPLEMSADEVMKAIRHLEGGEGLFRVHRTHSALYARARRLYGSWSEAVRLAGLDYDASLRRARERAGRGRRSA